MPHPIELVYVSANPAASPSAHPQFEVKAGRPVKLWLDKLCIDQAQISLDLRCLPVFLAGCNELLVTSGITYTSRLWCCVELFVYFSVHVEDAGRNTLHILVLANGDAEREAATRSWMRFD